MAAVWVTDEGLPHRSLCFITQHLCLTLKYTAHPADIEQSLVIGAHGPRSLTVVMPPAEE